MKSKFLRIIAFSLVWVLALSVGILSVAASYISFFGVDSYYGDVRKIYVKGIPDVYYVNDAIEATLTPNTAETITSDDVEVAKTIIETRLVNNNITDYEINVDSHNHQIIVRIPIWRLSEKNFDAQTFFEKLGKPSLLTFCAGQDNTNVILKGSDDIKHAYATYDPNDTTKPVVALELTDDGTKKFAK
ncbi:MAG: hypothetical protein IKU82_04675, partial [Clostridia bacterium]|nr:hypothetical protein [Clostridia bacterium]